MKAIPEGTGLLLDTVTLIYHLEHHPVHGRTASALLRRIEIGELTAIIASLAFAELLVHPYRRGEDDVAGRVLRVLTTFPNLRVVDLDPQIADRAARLRARYGLRTPDSIHAASALEAGMDGIVTNDRPLSKLEAEGIRVWLFD